MRHRNRESRVVDFHRKHGLEIDAPMTVKVLEHRRNLMQEEMDEVWDVIGDLCYQIEEPDDCTLSKKKLVANLLKELADLQYTLSGTIISFKETSGDFDVVFNRVCESNMTKDVDLSNTGKVVKGPSYVPPYLEDCVR